MLNLLLIFDFKVQFYFRCSSSFLIPIIKFKKLVFKVYLNLARVTLVLICVLSYFYFIFLKKKHAVGGNLNLELDDIDDGQKRTTDLESA